MMNILSAVFNAFENKIHRSITEAAMMHFLLEARTQANWSKAKRR